MWRADNINYNHWATAQSQETGVTERIQGYTDYFLRLFQTPGPFSRKKKKVRQKGK